MPRASVVVIVGAGPRGTGVLERLTANAMEMLPTRMIEIHIVEPYPPGAGRIWRLEQSPLMWVNVPAANITMYTDETVECVGPIEPGPSLDEWASAHNASQYIWSGSYPNRQVHGQYLKWVFNQIVASCPANVSVSVHATKAVRLAGGPKEMQRVWLANEQEPLLADIVILALGHLDMNPDIGSAQTLDSAAKAGLVYFPPAYPPDTDLSNLRSKEKMIVRGMGLCAVDTVTLLTEGRGGTYDNTTGELSYKPSGDEPEICIGSRRGVPYLPKFSYGMDHGPAPLPRFFDVDQLELDIPQRVDFRTDLWPVMAKEIGWSYYHELFAAHSDRVACRWDQFSAMYAELDWGSDRLDNFIRRHVPHESDRLDLCRLDRPLAETRNLSFDDLQYYMRSHISNSIERRSSPAFSADLGAFMGFRSVASQLLRLLNAGRVTAQSEAEDVSGWWQGIYDSNFSGPPEIRARKLLALSRAGVVKFLGAEMWTTVDNHRGVFRAGSACTPQTVEATALLDARIPPMNLRNCDDSLLRGLIKDGEAAEYIRVDDSGFCYESGLIEVSSANFRMVDQSGRSHPRRFAIGPFTSSRYFTTFTSPRRNGLSFRQNDILARSALQAIQE